MSHREEDRDMWRDARDRATAEGKTLYFAGCNGFTEVLWGRVSAKTEAFLDRLNPKRQFGTVSGLGPSFFFRYYIFAGDAHGWRSVPANVSSAFCNHNMPTKEKVSAMIAALGLRASAPGGA